MLKINGRNGFSEERYGIYQHVARLVERFPGTKVVIAVEANTVHELPEILRQELYPQFRPGTLIFMSGWKSKKIDHMGVLTHREEKVAGGTLLYDVVTSQKCRLWKDLFSVASDLDSRYAIRELLSKQLKCLRWDYDESGCRTVTGKSPGNQDDMGIAVMLGLLWAILVAYNDSHAQRLGLFFPSNSVPLTHEAKLLAMYSTYHISERIPDKDANVSTMIRKKIRMESEYPAV